MMTRSVFFLMALVCFVPAARAHMGHVGELAGHAHWVGVAAVLGAAALAALVAKAGQKAEQDSDDIEPESDDQVEEASP